MTSFDDLDGFTGIKELLSNEDVITLVLIHKAKKGDISVENN